MERKIVTVVLLTLLLTSMFTLTFNFQPVRSEPTTITVPDDYPTIQAAINAANDGDTIYVRANTYYENVVVNKSLSLIGTDKFSTIIDGNHTGNVIAIVSSNVTITGLTVQNSGYYPNCGIYAEWTTGNSISHNIIRYICRGIRLHGSSNNTVTGNNITACDGNGIILVGGSSRNNITGNDITNGGNGIGLDSSLNNVVSGNRIRETYDGIWLDYSSNNNTISGNNLINSSCGIRLNQSSDNTISGNNIQNNNGGIEIYFSSNNNIYHNNFVNNTPQVDIHGTNVWWPSVNVWDDGNEGNYWSDYRDKCPDAKELDDSGIWDTPYAIDENNQDNYPLMNPYTDSNQPPSAFIDSISPNPADERETVTFQGHGEDLDGYILEYRWESDREDFLSDQASFSTSSLSVGVHHILFDVRDNEGACSETAIETLTIIPEEPSNPIPIIVSVSCPDSAILGEWVTITIVARNYGAKADEMYISASLPDNPPIDNVHIVSHDLQDAYVLPVGYEVWRNYGHTHPIVLKYPLVEGFKENWGTDETKTLQFKVKPQHLGTFRVLVKTTAQVDGDWSYDPQSGIVDQQNEYVYEHTIDIIPNVPMDKSAVIVDPFYSEWTDKDHLYEVQDSLEEAGYSVSIIREDGVTVEWLRENLRHGVVLWRGHMAHPSPIGLVTGEKVTDENTAEYKEDIENQRIGYISHSGSNYWAIKPEFIEYYYESNRLQYSLVVVEGCKSLSDNSLASAFVNVGAGSYIGFIIDIQEPIASWCAVVPLFQKLCEHGYTVEEAVDSVGWSLAYYGDPDLRLTALSDSTAGIMFVIQSPAHLYVMDPEGRHIGFDPATNQTVFEIPEAMYTGPEFEPQVIWIPKALNGTYEVLLIGTNNGTYNLTISQFTFTGRITRTRTGTISTGQILSYKTSVAKTDIALYTFKILSPQNTTYTTTSIPLEVFIDEQTSWMAYSLDRQANITITGNTTLTGLSDGMHSLIVYVNDTVGNTVASETIHFTIETSQPFPSMWIVAVIVIITAFGTAVYLLIIRKKRPKQL